MYAINDDLHDFAEWWIANGSYMPQSSIQTDNHMIQKIYCKFPFQVEMVFSKGGVVIPNHVHPNGDSIEVGVFGGVRLSVNGEDPYPFVSDDRLSEFTRMRGLRINSTDLHGGKVLDNGACFLSIQKWKIEPSSFLIDYVGPELDDKHKLNY